MVKVAIIGAGGFGVALSVLCDSLDYDVRLWSLFSEEIESIIRDGEHKKLLPGVSIPERIVKTCDISCTAVTDLIIMAVPSFAVRDTARLIKPHIANGAIVANAAKGFEPLTNLRLSEVLSQELPNARIVALSGPSHAEEVSRNAATALVAASKDRAAAEFVSSVLSCGTLRIYISDDLIGAELGGALKNIIALAAGILDGMSCGDNTKAALMTRGIKEISRLGTAMGGKAETFGGLTGIGDLIVTCTSAHSRNRRAGMLIGQGKSAAEASKIIGMTVEGISAAHCAYSLAKKFGVEMPIVNEMDNVLSGGKDAKAAIADLMKRPLKFESE